MESHKLLLKLAWNCVPSYLSLLHSLTGTHHCVHLLVEMGILQTLCLVWPPTVILLISTSQVAKITGVSYWCLATPSFLCHIFSRTALVLHIVSLPQQISDSSPNALSQIPLYLLHCFLPLEVVSVRSCVLTFLIEHMLAVPMDMLRLHSPTFSELSEAVEVYSFSESGRHGFESGACASDFPCFFI
jgi:hypothetical protein